ncbi:Response regulator receiver domain-containing protein [Roseateles sp. YR242]|uniref:ATP-binding response regulator n=1 Tax=Roseateles sp. YR242 TaxID=1855305 RepID=UPI0008D28906|nr:response regulator [Roseateles sp. YR242]SEL17976.1 Response regulator receiver domain-containing protein [Roseateles sp. YR242]
MTLDWETDVVDERILDGGRGVGDVSARRAMNVLVVDDKPQNLLAMKALLADGLEPGLQVLTASSGPAALELLLTHEVMLALLDVQMPGMDGFALAELMRGTERTRHVPIIFLTAGARETQRSFKGYEAGAVDFIYKPVDAHVLRSKVVVFADLHRQRQLLAERIEDQERLARVNALMLSALSHDIRGPLSVMMLNAELLIRQSEQPTLQKAGIRMKAAATLLGRQVDHLGSLAQRPCELLQVHPRRGDLAVLAAQRLDLESNQAVLWAPPDFDRVGDTTGDFDHDLLARAIDQLLMQAATHAGDSAIRIQVDGSAHRSLMLRINFDNVLSPEAAIHLFGGHEPVSGMASPHVGPGLEEPERIARAHGGSLIGGSRQRQGTLLELLLPRHQAEKS